MKSTLAPPTRSNAAGSFCLCDTLVIADFRGRVHEGARIFFFLLPDAPTYLFLIDTYYDLPFHCVCGQ